MMMPLSKLIERLTQISRECGDPEIGVILDGFTYLHAKQGHPHQLELVNVPERDRKADTMRDLRDQLARAQAELRKYRDAYG